MAKIVIAKNVCKGCGLCSTACTKGIVQISKTVLNNKGYFVAECTDETKCIGCALCAVMCPDCAIEVFR